MSNNNLRNFANKAGYTMATPPPPPAPPIRLMPPPIHPPLYQWKGSRNLGTARQRLVGNANGTGNGKMAFGPMPVRRERGGRRTRKTQKKHKKTRRSYS